ncbi:MAG: NrfD/PsrC family molybdoenzyme membrane anchor subunit [Nitrospirota bacterium]
MKRFIDEHKIVSLLLLLGVLVLFYRLFWGLGAVSDLSDSQPWGLIKAFNILACAALAAGATVVAAMAYVFGLKRFEPVVRPVLLMGLIAHTFVLGALLYDVGSPIDIWRIVLTPNIRSIMFLAFLCEVVYTGALICEALPEYVGPGRYEGLVGFLKSIRGLVIVVSAVIAVIYQSTLGALYLVSPHRITPLWYSPWLPVLFFLSAVAGGLAVVIVEAYISDKAGRRPFDNALMGQLGRIMSIFLVAYVVLRIADMAARGALSVSGGAGTGWFIVEISVGFLAPAILITFKNVRENPTGLLTASALVTLGVVMNRLGVAIIGWRNQPGVTYFPTALEICVSFFFILAPVAIYSFASGALLVPEGRDKAIHGLSN